jgi:WD40 repeat protein
MQCSGMKNRLLVVLCGALLAVTAPAQTNVPAILWQVPATNSFILNPLAVAPDGATVATAGAGDSVQIRRLSDGSPITNLLGRPFHLAFSPDGAFLATGGGGGTISVWRVTDWSLAYSFSIPYQGPVVVFSPDSTTLAVGNSTTIELRRVTNGALFHSWTATTGRVEALAFSPDGTMLASGAGVRGKDINLVFWGIPSGNLIRSIPTAQTYGIASIAFSPDGSQVLTGSEYLYSGPMQLWRVSDGALLRTYPFAAYAASFSPDGAVFAAIGTNIAFFRATDGKLVQEYSDKATDLSARKDIALASLGRFVWTRGRGDVLAGQIPLLISSSSIESGQIVIRWVGGSGRYQLQRAAEIGGAWQDEGGILTTNSVAITPSTPSAFYQVIALP